MIIRKYSTELIFTGSLPSTKSTVIDWDMCEQTAPGGDVWCCKLIDGAPFNNINHIPSKLWDKITYYPFANFSGAT